MEKISCFLFSWSPEAFVNLVGEIAWPLVILILGWRSKESFKQAIEKFFKDNNVTEINASTAGVSAKFEARKQNIEAQVTNNAISSLPVGKDAESIKHNQSERSTYYSSILKDEIVKHLNAMAVSEKEQIDLLETEVSILQATILFLSISAVLFKSQFDLFNQRLFPENEITLNELNDYFQNIKASAPEGLFDWDVKKYIEYPISAGLIERFGDNYKLSKIGKSFVQFMRNNPIAIEHLSVL